MTGYVHNMIERKQTFQEFALSCARAFGALVEMRDDDMNAKVPAKFEPGTYYVKELEKAEKELRLLLRMNNDQKIAFGLSKQDERVSSLTASQKKHEAETAQLKAMLDEVKAWEPPTDEHAGLKSFMTEQLTTSMDSGDWYKKEINNAVERSAMAYYTDAVGAAERSIERSKEQHVKEIERTNGRNEWIKKLRDSLAEVNA